MTHRPNPVEALHAALLSSCGIAAAARAIGRSTQVMYNKFSEAAADVSLTGHEERALADVSKSDAYVQAVCAYFGGVFFRLPDGLAGNDDVLEAYLSIIKRMGDLSKDFMTARDDGIIDPVEFETLRNDAYATMAALRTLLAELETMVQPVPAVKPALRVASMPKAG